MAKAWRAFIAFFASGTMEMETWEGEVTAESSCPENINISYMLMKYIARASVFVIKSRPYNDL